MIELDEWYKKMSKKNTEKLEDVVNRQFATELCSISTYYCLMIFLVIGFHNRPNKVLKYHI
jgi:hypothetical protein